MLEATDSNVRESSLITLGDRQYTPLHLPLMDELGNPTEKADWNLNTKRDISKKIEALIAGAGQTIGPYRKPEGPDFRAQLDGIVAPTIPSAETIKQTHSSGSKFVLPEFRPPAVSFKLNISARNAYLPIGPSWRGAELGNMSDFSEALFVGETDFSQTLFAYAIYFPKAVFVNGANFARSTFSNGAQFRDAIFTGGATFANATFTYDCDFSSTYFLQAAHFYETQFSANAFFRKTEFLGDVVFRDSTFKGIADFQEAKFTSGIRSYNTIVFDRAIFEKYTTFECAYFSGSTTFHETEFHTTPNFSELSTDNIKKLEFTSSKFLGPTKFSVKSSNYPRQLWDRALLDAQLPTLFDTVSKGLFSEFAAFDGAIAQGRIDFSDKTLKGDAGFSVALTRAKGISPPGLFLPRKIWNIIRRGKNPIPIIARMRKTAGNPSVVAARDARLKALEGGCRVIKLSNEDLRDRLLEQRFYTYELIARRHNTSTPNWERIFSYLFDLTAKYGSSVTRPLSLLGGVWAAFGAIFWTIATGTTGKLGELLTYSKGDKLDASVFEALTLSGEMVFRPFFVWGVRRDSANVVGNSLLIENGADIALLTRLLATLESFVAIVLLFLVALAIRRRFQIN